MDVPRGLLALLLLATVAGANNSSVIVFEPEDLTLVYEELTFQVNFTTAFLNVTSFNISSSDEYVATVLADGSLQTDDGMATGAFEVTTVKMGYATLNVTLLDAAGQILTSEPFEVSVLLSNTSLSSIFSTTLGVLVACMYVVMGSTIDLSIVKTIVKKPIGPLLGLFCQYCCMPLIAFGMSQLVFTDTYLQLGMFMAGCSPGGGPSNIWTHLLGGNLDLSITMTFTSTIMALGAIPTWVLLLGPVISEGSNFVIPYDRIAISLVLLVVPCGFGVFAQFYLKPVARFFAKILTPLSIFNVLYISTFGLYANRYIFGIIDVKIFFSALCLPFLGYLAGLSSALLLRQSRQDAIAISLETGIQNATVALFLLNLTLPQPASLIAVVIPGFVAIFTPLPLLCIFLVKTGVQKLRSRRNQQSEKEKAPQETAISTISEKTPVKPSEKPELNGVDNPAADIQEASS